MQYFQSILIVVGLFAIGGVLIHGYLLSRKAKSVTKNTSKDVDMFSEKDSPVLDAFPDDVISDVRIINHGTEVEEDNIDFSHAVNDEQVAPFAFADRNADPIVFTEKNADPIVFTEKNADPIVFTEKNTESSFYSDEVVPLHTDIINDNSDIEVLAEPISVDVPKPESDTDDVVQPQDLFIFNVVAKEDSMLGGHEILQFFLTSGFRFGEMSLFHRHQHSDGHGPILFSIANMMTPGIFDPDTMEQFKSEGVSFFLTAPNKEIDIKASFELMLRAVEQMAEEFDCIVLNAEREPMTQEQFIEYNHRLLHYI
jgi:cell division protein ZipA